MARRNVDCHCVASHADTRDEPQEARHAPLDVQRPCQLRQKIALGDQVTLVGVEEGDLQPGPQIGLKVRAKGGKV